MLVPSCKDKLYKRYKTEQKKNPHVDFLSTLADGLDRMVDGKLVQPSVDSRKLPAKDAPK